MKNNQNILICPLEWGLGHAARMIPFAARLRDMGNNIIIGAGDEHLALFRREMPGTELINFPGFKPVYSRLLPQYLALLVQTPVLLFHIIKEHYRLKQIILDYNIDMVVSDNRFGLWNKKVKCVYITHLPLIPLPPLFFFFEFIGILLHRAVIRKYDYCYIPDLPGELNISGRLSHGIKLPGNTRFIGILSRFSETETKENEIPAKFRHNTVILSGPEPQRGILKKKLSDILKEKELPVIFLEGNPGNQDAPRDSGNLIFNNHLCAAEMKALLIGSEYIITRSGYTTIMELISLNCSALLIPTPGQTEQEYLARYLEEKGWFRSITQKKLSKGMYLPETRTGWTGEIIVQSRELLGRALKELSEK